MIAYLILCTLLITANGWAAITPHLHSDLSMRILHGLSTVALLPLLWNLWTDRRLLQVFLSIVLSIFTVMLVLVNSWIAMNGMGVDYGWLDHVMLALAFMAVVVFFLLRPEPDDDHQPTASERIR
ncbi:MAG: hypothetical protein CL822_01830 [Crocinitomicaceae bacterium]|nr:hypothetical protein [Crocinitomicaceae bacterium]